MALSTIDGTLIGGNVIVAGTVEPAGDTAAGDNAAIGFTAAEGLILTGQGSTSDIAIKNDADTLVASVATGTTVMNFASAITVGGSALSNTATNAAVTGTVVKGTTSLQTPLIEFTDGDDAIAIADGGVVTLLTTAVSKSEGGAVTHNITQGLLKHWINFGMDDAAINDSFNNTSVADIAAGDYTVTIANNFANAVYAISFEQTYVDGHGTSGHQSSDTTKTTTLVRVYAFRIDTGSASDTVEAMVQSAGDLA